MGNISEALLQEIALEEEQKIVSIDPGMEFLNNELLEEAEGYHPMFAQYMSIMEMLYACRPMIYDHPKARKHRKMVQKLEKSYSIGASSTPILDSYFGMWEFFDLEVEEGQTFADIVTLLGKEMGLAQEGLIILDALKGSINSLYTCQEAVSDWALLRSIITGGEFGVTLTEGLFLEEGKNYMMRLVPADEDTFLSMTTPYELKASEKKWREFFENQGIYGDEDFDLGKYKTFMKKGKSHRYWFDYIQRSASSLDAIPILLEGTPP